MNRFVCSALFISIGMVLLVPDAHAYLDPGSGSFIIQAAIAAVVGISVALKMYWHNIKKFISRLFSK